MQFTRAHQPFGPKQTMKEFRPNKYFITSKIKSDFTLLFVSAWKTFQQMNVNCVEYAWKVRLEKLFTYKIQSWSSLAVCGVTEKDCYRLDVLCLQIFCLTWDFVFLSFVLKMNNHLRLSVKARVINRIFRRSNIFLSLSVCVLVCTDTKLLFSLFVSFTNPLTMWVWIPIFNILDFIIIRLSVWPFNLLTFFFFILSFLCWTFQFQIECYGG